MPNLKHPLILGVGGWDKVWVWGSNCIHGAINQRWGNPLELYGLHCAANINSLNMLNVTNVISYEYA